MSASPEGSVILPRAPRRQFLFLQGPPGPFFSALAGAVAKRGAGVHRINLSGGDRYDWTQGATNYRGRMRDWPIFFDRYVRRHGVTDLVVYGDCRPMHQAAMRMAKLRGLHVYVFEEGYIRPNWMTLERDGVNGHSPFFREAHSLLEGARWLPPVPDQPAITADFKRRARDSYWHYHHVVTGRLLLRFPFYRSHRQGSIMLDGIGWALKFLRARRRRRQAEAVEQALPGQRYFLFPLQLTGDYQIRAHSPFGSMPVAVEYVLDSFAVHAPGDAVLLVKEHPLDSGFRNWRRFLRGKARALGIEDRVLHIDGGDLQALSTDSVGMVCVNSTSGTLGLATGKPVIVLGDAVYNIPGITHQGGLDQFWSSPEPPDPALYEAFKRSLYARCLVRGGLASVSAMRILVENSVERLFADTGATGLGRQDVGSSPALSR
ncbi:MAG: capsular biosynthesis protein [Sphingomonadales bacterium]|nr:capsular biosynthesis protein [Sphingomonadales bacterium]MDE2570633.1 capsular biosynthesis protein [Sphingomonadales bacterium]